jgi:hypothetical protein
MPLIDREELRKLMVSLLPEFPEPTSEDVERGALLMEKLVIKETQKQIEGMKSAEFQAGLNDVLDKFMNFSGKENCG